MVNKRKSNTGLKILICICIAVVAILVGFLVWKINYDEEIKQNTPRDVLVKEDTGETKNEGDSSEETSENTGDEKEPIPQYDGEDPNLAENLSGVLTYAKIMKDVLVMRVNIDQYINEGECELTIKNGDDEIYTGKVAIVDAASTSTCNGFDVPMGSIQEGTLKIIINLTGDEKTGVITGEVNI